MNRYRIVYYFDLDNEIRVEVQEKSFFGWKHRYWKKYNKEFWELLLSTKKFF